MKFVSQLNENNITQSRLSTIVDEQEASYVRALEHVMMNKDSFIKNIKLYENEIFRLEKIIAVNSRAGNSYAVIRDEAKVKSYRLLHNQNRMIKDILSALDYSSSVDFTRILNDLVTKNQLDNQEIISSDYNQILEMQGVSKTLLKAKQNIVDLKMLIDINLDLLNHLYAFENRMFRLNEYANYNLIGIVLYINNTEIAKIINPVLEFYGLNIMKIISILVLFAMIYFIRKVFYLTLERYLLKVKSFVKYSAGILQKIRKPLESIIILINLELTIYIYNDFIHINSLSRAFNIFYAFFIMWLIYRVVNVIVSIKIHEFDYVDSKIKNEMINVGMKSINFMIMLIGLLIILYLAGVNLTTVLSGLGIGGFAVALAAKDSLSNFFGTLSILLGDVFSQGDWIVIDGNEGVVIEIGLRVTTLRTFDNALIAIPNVTLANKEVKNWDRRTLGRRIKMSLGIKYDSSSQNIKNAVDEIRDMLDKHPNIATKNTKYEYKEKRKNRLVSRADSQGVKKTLLVYLDEFSDSSINILVYCFTKSTMWEDWLATKEDVMHKIMEIFEKNNLEFAFPSFSVYHENELVSKND
ncbi:MAG: mechanosensitive ion channel family protein [Campylobacterota bacterium]|nr:mechanosensitive ion channel family protein [Campylobacterota bacterium]